MQEDNKNNISCPEALSPTAAKIPQNQPDPYDTMLLLLLSLLGLQLEPTH
jgi:hypothetical protein